MRPLVVLLAACAAPTEPVTAAAVTALPGPTAAPPRPARAPDWKYEISYAWSVSTYPVGDLDGDGLDDVAVSSSDYFGESSFLSLARSTPEGWTGGLGNIGLPPNGFGWTFPISRPGTELDGDGVDDLVVAFVSFYGTNDPDWPYVRVLHGGTDGVVGSDWVREVHSTRYGDVIDDGYGDGDRRESHVTRVGDLDGDGVDELVSVRRDEAWCPAAYGSGSWVRVHSRLQTCAGDLVSPCTVLEDDGHWNHRALVTAGYDEDGDGRDDLVDGLGWYHSSRGFTTPSALASSGGDWIAMPDLDGDGDDDTLRVVAGAVWFYPEVTAVPRGLPALASYGARPVGDVNGDGFGDLAVDRGVTIDVFAGSAHGPTDTLLATLGADDGAREVTLGGGADVDGDGLSDVVGGAAVGLAAASFEQGHAVAWLGRPDRDADGDPDGTDCAPDDPAIGASIDEIPGDGVDQDCDRREACWDEGAVDGDGDGFLAANAPTLPSDDVTCGGAAARAGGDCDDVDPDVRPGAKEVRCDAVDQDCDGVDDCAPPVPPVDIHVLPAEVDTDVPRCAAWDSDAAADTAAPADTEPGPETDGVDSDLPSVHHAVDQGCSGCDAGRPGFAAWLAGASLVLRRRRRSAQGPAIDR